MSIIQPTSTTSTTSIDPAQAKLEKAQRKAERAARRLAKAEKAQLKASSSTPTLTLTPTLTHTPAATSTSTTSTTMPITTPTKKEKKRKASSIDEPTTTTTTTSSTSPNTDLTPDLTSTPTSTSTSPPNPTDPPAPKRQKSKKSKSAAKQLGRASSHHTEADRDADADHDGEGVSPTASGGGIGDVDVDVAGAEGTGTEDQTVDGGKKEEVEMIPTTPADDSKLDEQAKKALIYAQTYVQNKQDPTIVWKFNKAKQNWLVRNVWSVELIPGRWVELVIGYLKTMQGIAQKNLVAEAKKHLATPIIAPLNTDDVRSTTETAESPAAPSSDAVAESTADDGEEKSEAEIVVEDARTKEVKDRARRILTAVGVDCWSV